MNYFKYLSPVSSLFSALDIYVPNAENGEKDAEVAESVTFANIS